MLKIKETESKVTLAKKNITISDIKFSGDTLVDEEGSITARLKDALGDNIDTFTLKISIELLEEDSDDEGTEE